MNEELSAWLQYLGLNKLLEDWDSEVKTATKKQPSYSSFLAEIIKKECFEKKENARCSRMKRARIPEPFTIETFPFSKQPRLKKKLVLELYDSLNFLNQKQELVFIGPTGCGKTGLATSFLTHAINKGYRGCFIDFRELVDQLYESKGTHTEKKIIKRFLAFEVLLIDELGYAPLEKEQAGLFFDLMKKRHKNNTTIITTQLGFEEWGSFLKNQHLTAALLDRITENCTVFNMKDCISIRPKNIVYATRKSPAEEKP